MESHEKQIMSNAFVEKCMTGVGAYFMDISVKSHYDFPITEGRFTSIYILTNRLILKVYPIA